MALSQSISFPTLHKHQLFVTCQNMRTLVLPTTEFARYSLISSFPKARSKPRSPLRTVSCVAGANSDDGIREASSTSTSISSVFVKGLPDSVSEGRLKKVFSEFGQVSHGTIFLAVKIIINERTRQSLGYGYVWFNSKEDAQSAVEAMNGKVYKSFFQLQLTCLFSAVLVSYFGGESSRFCFYKNSLLDPGSEELGKRLNALECAHPRARFDT